MSSHRTSHFKKQRQRSFIEMCKESQCHKHRRRARYVHTSLCTKFFFCFSDSVLRLTSLSLTHVSWSRALLLAILSSSLSCFWQCTMFVHKGINLYIDMKSRSTDSWILCIVWVLTNLIYVGLCEMPNDCLLPEALSSLMSWKETQKGQKYQNCLYCCFWTTDSVVIVFFCMATKLWVLYVVFI